MVVDKFFSDFEAGHPNTTYFQVAQSIQGLGFQNMFLHTRRVSDKCLPVPHYSSIPPFFKLVFPFLRGLPLFFL